jgi:Fic family protein
VQERNSAYKKHYQQNLAEITQLRRVAQEKELRAIEAVLALEAPIVTVTQALVKVLSEPELVSLKQDSRRFLVAYFK